jgi:transmembrane sensor
MPDAGSVIALKSAMSGDTRLRHQTVAREAAQWLVLLHSGEANDNDVQACQRWRVADPEHEGAWQRAERINQKFGQVPREIGLSALNRLQRLDRRARPTQGK